MAESSSTGSTGNTNSTNGMNNSTTADTPSSVVVEDVLTSASLFGVLGLPDEEISPDQVKKAYRKKALLVHPDKCKHKEAKAAFQRLSEAYEALSSATAQRRYLSFSGQKQQTKQKDQQRPKQQRRRWWEDVDFETFERRWRRREEAERTMRTSFVSSMSQKFGKRRLTDQLVAIEQTTEQLDMGKSLLQSDLWPPRVTGEEDTDDSLSFFAKSRSAPGVKDAYLPKSERAELEDVQYVTGRFSDCNEYLRDEHSYCFFCGRAYESQTELNRLCPGATEQSHEESQPSSQYTEGAGAGGQSSAVEAFEADPLDAFMAGVQTEVSEQKRKDKERWAKHKRQGKDKARSGRGGSGSGQYKKRARWGGWS